MTRRARRLSIGAWTAGTLAASVAGGYLFYHVTAPASAARTSNGLHGDAIYPGQGRPAPAISLDDQYGQHFRLASQRGHVVIVTFLDSHCHNLCPIEGRELRAVDNTLPPSQRPVIVVVSVNPADTRKSVEHFVSVARWNGPWYWLMGTKSQLAPVWKQYGIQVVTLKQTIDGVHVSSIGHSTAIYLLDGRGRERTGYVAPFLPAQVAEDVRTLERG